MLHQIDNSESFGDNTKIGDLYWKDSEYLLQVIKTRIQAFDPATKRMQLTLATKITADMAKEDQSQASQDFKPGELWEASVASIESNADNRVSAYKVHLLLDGAIVGSAQLDVPHLSDNPGALEALQEGIQVCIPPASLKLEVKIIPLFGLFRKVCLLRWTSMN